MRTIVAFILTALVAAAQIPAEIERLEKAIADRPDNPADRQAVQRALTNFSAGPEKLRADRRELILWMIEHEPESKVFEEPFAVLWPHGKLGDPEGYAQAAQLWKDRAAKPAATGKTIANAALFFRILDPAQSVSILNRAKDRAADPDVARARGILDATVMLGIAGIDDNNRILLTSSGAARASSAANRARTEIEASQSAELIGSAGVLLTRRGNIQIPGDLAFGDDDVPTLAERWLRRARELGWPEAEWKNALGDAVHQKAERTNDPREKIRLLTEAFELMPDSAKQGIRAQIAVAEFSAGDDAAAENDARPMADKPRNTYEFNLAQTLLGRIALARGDKKEARERLFNSLKPPASFKNPSFEPMMTLAQDLYDEGDRDAVLEFLEASRTVWRSDRGRIDRMIGFVKKAPSVDLVALARQYPGSGMLRGAAPAFETKDKFAGKIVALDFGNSPAAQRIATERGVALVHIQDEDTRRRFEVLTLPTVIVIDRQGNVAAYRSGPATEAELRADFEATSGSGASPVLLPAPKQGDPVLGARGKVSLTWEPLENAESYVVEWDSHDETGWTFDREKTVRVIPTRNTSAILDLNGFTRVRWRVYAVPKTGAAGKQSSWNEITGIPVTKIYK